MNNDLIVELDPPRIEHRSGFLIAGLGERFTFETNHGIPRLWQKFGPCIGQIPGQQGSVTYGVCCRSDAAGSFEYIAGVEVSGFADIPANFSRLQLPAQKYVVFSHRDHISSIRNTVYTIWNQWLPGSQYQHAERPDFERYDEDFDPQTGVGLVQIWVPIK